MELERDPEKAIRFKLRWVGLDNLPVLSANQYELATQPDGYGFVLSIGHATPPVLYSESPDDHAQEAAGIEFLPIQPVVRLGLTDAALLALRQEIDLTLGSVLRHEHDDNERDDDA